MNIEYILPQDIERRSFEIIESELGENRKLSESIKPVVLRVIHTTADFDYYDNLCFSENAVEIMTEQIKNGAIIVTDTNMALAGINKAALKKHGCEAFCYMADADVAEAARANGTTRAAASVDKAARLGKPVIFVCGNAPTALIRLSELIKTGEFVPAFVVGVPVGFVNVVQSKELIMQSGVPYIVARGRKGGSNVAAAICNAVMYEIDKRE